MAQFLQEPSVNGAGRVISQAVAVCSFATEYPALFEHLTETAWPSGKARVTSTLTIFSEDGVVKLCLKDRSSLRTAWASCRTVSEAFRALEAGLEGDSLEWRRDRPLKK